MPRYVPERPDVMGKMEDDQRDAINGGSPDDEILQYLVDRYHPSFRELRRIRNPMGSFTPVNERVLVSDKTTRREINQYNRSQRLIQEIGAIKEDWKVLDGIRRVWVYVLLRGADAAAAQARNTQMIEGAQEKDKRLSERARNPRKYAREADRVRARVLLAIRKGKRRGGAGVT